MPPIEATSARLGQRIREERKRQGMDQRMLALVSNVGVRSVHRVENGEPTVRLDVVLRILDALGLRLEARGRDES